MATKSVIGTISRNMIQHTSKREQRMRKLSCMIFNDFYIPELKRHEADYGIGHPTVLNWYTNWVTDYRVWERNQEKPIDLDSSRNHNYFPALPQLRKLSDVLRDYGLFRDEHRDFREEMKKKTIARGKTFRKRGGGK